MRGILLAIVSIALLGCQSGTGGGDKPADVTTDKQKLSYSLGYSIGGKVVAVVKQQAFDVDTTAYLAGLGDVFTGTDPVIPKAALESIVSDFDKDAAKRHAQKQTAAASSVKAEGTAFLAENRTKEGVVELESGLQYKMIKDGKGKSPGPTDEVTVHYAGRLLDGTEFDSSVKRGQPATFPLNRVIPGWTEGLQLIKEGGKAELYIPSDLGYGDRGSPPKIPGGATLIFEIELISVK